MPTAEQMINRILFDKAKELHDEPRIVITFTNIPESDALLNNIETYPHLFVLGCIMDRQVQAEKAWNIPIIIAKECGGPGFANLLSLNIDDLNSIFLKKRLHRFNEQMAGNFHAALQIIHDDYQDNAANIWLNGQPCCREVIERFERFPGVGQKISTMATNILVRQFKVPLKNVNDIDISVDSQVQKVFKRLGMVPADASNQDIIEAARKIYPSYPGIADSVIWELGREWCKADLSGCQKCYLNDYCPKNPVQNTQDMNPAARPRGRQHIGSIVAKTNSSAIKAGKYRPRFEELLRIFHKDIAQNCTIRSTSSNTNAHVNVQGHPYGVLYEFDDWNDRISIELQLNRSRAPQLQQIVMAISKRVFANLPSPELKYQGEWLRLQFFFNEDVPPQMISEAMHRLIKQTQEDLGTG